MSETKGRSSTSSRGSARADASDVTIRYADHIRRARERIAARRFPAAWADLSRAVGLDPERPDAFNLLGVLKEIRGDRLGAQTLWRVSLDLDPRYTPARDNLARSTRRNTGFGSPCLG